MKFRLTVILLLVLLFAAFSLGCGEDELSAQEVLAKSIKATTESNSTVFEMDTEQIIEMPGVPGMVSKTVATGKSIKEPLAVEIEMQTDMGDMQMDMMTYLVDDMFYMSIPGLGWVMEDLTEGGLFAHSYENPFEYFDMLEKVGIENAVMEKAGDYYLLTYKDDDGALAELMKEKVKAQMGGELFDDPYEVDVFGAIDFSDLHYSIAIDNNTFLPTENIIAFKMTMEMMDEKMSIEQSATIKYLEFGTFDAIIIPDEVINEAVPLDNIFGNLNTGTDETQPGEVLSEDGQGRIVFNSDRDGNSDLYVMDADGANLQRLTVEAGEDFSAAWSPDGKSITFASDREGSPEIYIMDADGNNQERLTFMDTFSTGPSWSPDGQKIAFNAVDEGLSQIYVMNADGSNVVRLTDHAGDSYSPSWSPDGSKILYELYESIDGGAISIINVMDSDGSNKAPLTTKEHSNFNPSWSPDGLKIAFASGRDLNWQLYLMDSDGSNQEKLFSIDQDCLRPTWSPDGQQIAFTLVYDWDNTHICTIKIDGSDMLQLTDEPGINSRPSWSP